LVQLEGEETESQVDAMDLLGAELEEKSISSQSAEETD
jgi:hypothetical protein